MSLGLRVLLTLASRVGSALAGLVSAVILARGLGPDGKGAYELVLSVTSLGMSWGGLGIAGAVSYYAARGRFADADLKATLLWWGAIWSGLMGLVALVVVRQLGGSLLRDIDPSLLFVAVILIPPLAMLQFQRAYLLGRGRLIAYNGVNLSVSAATSMLLLGAVGLMGAGLPGAVGAYAVVQLVALGMLLSIHRTPSGPISGLKRAGIFGELMKFGGKAQIGDVLLYFNHRADLFIINLYLGTTIVGYYSVATALAEAVWYIPRTMALVLMPYVAESEHERAERIIPILCRNTLLLSLFAAFVLAAAAPLVVRKLFGDMFLPALVPLWLLLPGVVLFAWAEPLASFQVGRGRPLTSLYVALLSLPVGLSVYLLLIPPFGIVGAAVASTVSYVLVALLELLFVVRASRMHWSDLILPRRSDWMYYRDLLASVKTRWLTP